jgi:hypothetical protein
LVTECTRRLTLLKIKTLIADQAKKEDNKNKKEEEHHQIIAAKDHSNLRLALFMTIIL